jgi:hypothetical protein
MTGRAMMPPTPGTDRFMVSRSNHMVSLSTFMVSLSNHESARTAGGAIAFMVRQAHHEGGSGAALARGPAA